MTKECSEKRERILKAAKKLVFHYGFKKTGMADIAEEAGVSVGTLYNFFKNKEEICSACAEEFKMSVVSKMREVAESKLSSEKKLIKMMLTRNLAYYDHLKDTPHALEIVTALLPKNKELMKRIEDMDQGLVEDVLKEGFDLGDFNAGDHKKTARTFLDAFSRFSPPMSIGLSENEIKEGTLEMVKLLLKAIGPGCCENAGEKAESLG